MCREGPQSVDATRRFLVQYASNPRRHQIDILRHVNTLPWEPEFSLPQILSNIGLLPTIAATPRGPLNVALGVGPSHFPWIPTLDQGSDVRLVVALDALRLVGVQDLFDFAYFRRIEVYRRFVQETRLSSHALAQIHAGLAPFLRNPTVAGLQNVRDNLPTFEESLPLYEFCEPVQEILDLLHSDCYCSVCGTLLVEECGAQP